MREIHDLLKRYANLQAPEKTIKKAFIESVRECIGITIDISDIEVRKKTIRVNTASVIKAEIRLNQQDILEHIKERVGKDAPTAIY